MTRFIPLFALFLAPIAFAQEPTTAKVKYKDRTEIDFDGVELSALANKPSGVLVVVPPQGAFNPLIVLRTSFSSEMKTSVDSMK